MKKILLCILTIFLSFQLVSGYYLSDEDNMILDNFETELFELIDDSSNDISPEIIITYIDYLLATRELSGRQETLLEVLADDVSYFYYLGEYTDDFGNMLPEDCFDDEYYDEIDSMCYYDERYYVDEDTDFFSESYDHHGDHEHESEILATYEISADEIALLSGNESKKAREIWNLFTTIIPRSARGDLKLYQVIDDSESDSGAYVQQDGEDTKKWNMTINLDGMYTEGKIDASYSYSTLIHEYAHILTLGPSQMRYYPVSSNESVLERFSENCVTNLLQEGCLHEDAYLDDFIDIFWNDTEYLEKVRNEEISAYQGNELDYITEYAATNPGEDIAESFTYFVLNGKKDSETVAEQKLNFFYNYSELETLRKQIRSRLSDLK